MNDLTTRLEKVAGRNVGRFLQTNPEDGEWDCGNAGMVLLMASQEARLQAAEIERLKAALAEAEDNKISPYNTGLPLHILIDHAYTTYEGREALAKWDKYRP